MLLTFYGRAIEPDRVNDDLVDHGGFRKDATRNLLDWNKLPLIYPEIKSVRRLDFYTRDPGAIEMAGLIDWLSSGQPAILKVDGNPATSVFDEHFVTAVGALESGIMVADPYSGQIKPLRSFCLTGKPHRQSDPAAIWSIIYLETRRT